MSPERQTGHPLCSYKKQHLKNRLKI